MILENNIKVFSIIGLFGFDLLILWYVLKKIKEKEMKKYQK